MNKKNVIYMIILLGILIFAFWFRTFPARFGELQALDPFYLYRISEHVATHSLQPLEFDTLRKYPTGSIPLLDEYAAPIYVPAIMYQFVAPVGVSFFEFALIYPAFMGMLAVLIMFFVGNELFGKVAGLFSAFFLAFMPAFVARTSGGFFEKEPVSGVFMLLVVLFFMISFRKKDWRYGVLSGLSLAMMGISWGGVEFMYIIFSIFAIILVFLNKRIKNIIPSFIPAILIGVLLPQLFPHHSLITSSGIMISLAIAAAVLIRYGAERFELVKKETLPYIVPVLIIISVVGFLIATMFSDMAYSILERTLSLIYAKQSTAIGFTVAENQAGSFSNIIAMAGSGAADNILPEFAGISNYLTSWVFMLLGVGILIYRFFNKFNARILFSIIWLIGTIWSVFFAVRLIFLFAAPAALISGFFIAWLLRKASKIKITDNRKYVENTFLTLGVLFLLLIVVSINNVFYTGTMFATAVVLLFIYLLMKKSDQESTLKRIYEKIKGKKRIDILLAPVIIIIMTTLAINAVNGFVYSSSIGPSICLVSQLAEGEKCITLDSEGNQIMNLNNQPWYQALNFLATKTPENSSIISWWDFGYWFQTRGKRPTYADGGQGDRTMLAKWFTSSVSEWDSWKEWLTVTNDVSYILMDYTLPGKYGAISAIATEGDNIVAIAQFTNTGSYPQDNKTVYEFSSGPYKIWVPYEGNSFAGNPMFLFTKNDQIVSKMYLNHICTENGTIELNEKSPSIPGCVAFTPFGVFYVPGDAEDTIFSSLMFMDGAGLPVEKVFDNSVIRIYKVQ